MRYDVTALDHAHRLVKSLCASVVDFNRALFHAWHVSDKARLRGVDVERVEIRDETGKLHATIYSPPLADSQES